MRQIALPGLDKAILSDTVGFVSDLPTQLIAAFRATLEEVLSADLIIHVRDIAHPDSEAQRDDVMDVLSELGVAGEVALEGDGEDAPPIIEAWNKLDLLDDDAAERVRELAERRGDVMLLSAITGQGVDGLQRVISGQLTSGAQIHQLRLPLSDGAAIAWLHEHGEVIGSTAEDGEMQIDVRLSDSALTRFMKRGRTEV